MLKQFDEVVEIKFEIEIGKQKLPDLRVNAKAQDRKNISNPWV